jgi:hypothetical protein
MTFRPGDCVAVIPAKDALPEEVVEVATIAYASRVFVQLSNGRIYARHDGRCIGDGHGGYIVPATEEHRRALAIESRSMDEYPAAGKAKG